MAWLILLPLLVFEAIGAGQAIWEFLIIVLALVACMGRELDVAWGDAHNCYTAGRALLF